MQNLSTVYISFSLYLDRIVARDFSFHAFVISGVTDLGSPDISLNKMLYRVFQASDQPSNAWDFSIFNSFPNPRLSLVKLFY